jgi:PAS domain S-box-containing protein
MDYKQVLNELPDLIYVTLPDGATPIFYNRKWYKYTGLTEEEALNPYSNVVDPKDVDRVIKEIGIAASAKKGYEVEVRLKDGKTGEYKWFLSKACPIFNSAGEVQSYVGTSVDIHERKVAVRNMEEVYSKILTQRQERIKELEAELEIHKSKI